MDSLAASCKSRRRQQRWPNVASSIPLRIPECCIILCPIQLPRRLHLLHLWIQGKSAARRKQHLFGAHRCWMLTCPEQSV